MDFQGANRTQNDPESCAEIYRSFSSGDVSEYLYRLHPSKRTQAIIRKENAKIIKVQVLFLLATATVFLLSFYVRYYAASMPLQARIDGCAQQSVYFDWWDFECYCRKCIEEFKLGPRGKCLPP